MGYTVFDGGVAQFNGYAVGGAAGDLTVVSTPDLLAEDQLISVIAIAHDGDGDIVSVTDLTSEFSITADNTINNTGGTSSADALVAVQFARRSSFDS
jgi:hypothetical protein